MRKVQLDTYLTALELVELVGRFKEDWFYYNISGTLPLKRPPNPYLTFFAKLVGLTLP